MIFLFCRSAEAKLTGGPTLDIMIAVKEKEKLSFNEYIVLRIFLNTSTNKQWSWCQATSHLGIPYLTYLIIIWLLY